MYKREQKKKNQERKYVSKHLKVHLNKSSTEIFTCFFFIFSFYWCYVLMAFVGTNKKTWIQSTLKKYKKHNIKLHIFAFKMFLFYFFLYLFHSLGTEKLNNNKTYRGDNFWELMNYIVKLRVLKNSFVNY